MSFLSMFWKPPADDKAGELRIQLELMKNQHLLVAQQGIQQASIQGIQQQASIQGIQAAGTYTTYNTVPVTSLNNVNAITGQAIYHHVAYLPDPTGRLIDIQFCDALGKLSLITIDEAFMDIMAKVCAAHLKMQPPRVFAEPDFDLDELAAASELVESLDGARPEG